MKAKEVKLEITGLNADKNMTKVNMGTTSFLPDGMSFQDFMGDQLNFQVFNPAAEKKEETKEEEKVPFAQETNNTSNALPAQNNNSANNNSNSQIQNNHTLKLKDSADFFLTLDAKNLTQNDLDQLKQLTNNNGLPLNINQINGLNNFGIIYNNTGPSYKSPNFSKTLSDTLAEAYKNNRPIRIDVEKNTSIILKIDKDGKLSAQFLSTDKMMEMLLRDNLYLLKAKLDKEGLPYNELSYKDQSGNKDERQSKNQE